MKNKKIVEALLSFVILCSVLFSLMSCTTVESYSKEETSSLIKSLDEQLKAIENKYDLKIAELRAEYEEKITNLEEENKVISEEIDLLKKQQENHFSGLTMACLGSSSTTPVKVDRAYPTVVKETLDLKEVYSYGIGWSTLAYKEDCHCHPDSEYNHYPYIFRYADMQEADIIIVQGGGHNDFGCLIPIGNSEDSSTNTFYGGLNILLSGLKREFPNSYIVVMTGFNTYGDNGSPKDAKNSAGIYYREYANAIIEACDRHNIDCLDIYHNLPFDRTKDTVDNTHPTQDYIDNVWAPYICNYLRNNYKDKNERKNLFIHEESHIGKICFYDKENNSIFMEKDSAQGNSYVLINVNDAKLLELEYESASSNYSYFFYSEIDGTIGRMIGSGTFKSGCFEEILIVPQDAAYIGIIYNPRKLPSVYTIK